LNLTSTGALVHHTSPHVSVVITCSFDAFSEKNIHYYLPVKQKNQMQINQMQFTSV